MDAISDEVLAIIAAHPDVIRTRRIGVRSCGRVGVTNEK
jgi:hypothetical protein